MISVYIDGDNCPTLVLEFVAEYCRQNEFLLKIAANRKISIKNAEENSDYEMIVCPVQKDAADNYIIANAGAKSLVITKDVILAEKLVAENIITINDRGTVFEKNSIKYRMQDRDLNLQLAALGFGGKKEKNYNQENLEKFIKSFEKAISIIQNRCNS